MEHIGTPKMEGSLILTGMKEYDQATRWKSIDPVGFSPVTCSPQNRTAKQACSLCIHHLSPAWIFQCNIKAVKWKAKMSSVYDPSAMYPFLKFLLLFIIFLVAKFSAPFPETKDMLPKYSPRTDDVTMSPPHLWGSPKSHSSSSINNYLEILLYP